MTVITSWALSILGILLLVLFLNHLGLNVTADLGSMLRGTEHLLAQPLSAL
ncbi:MAG TPA: hypothetical protein VEH28_07695 [Thermoplasmata archaeon]|nr:hypothetical protein [Thermoplasmata archaeon]